MLNHLSDYQRRPCKQRQPGNVEECGVFGGIRAAWGAAEEESGEEVRVAC